MDKYLVTHFLKDVVIFCDFKTYINLISCCLLFYKEIRITDLVNINKKIKIKLNDNILKQPKYANILKLDANNNENIKDVSHLKSTLKVLYAKGKCGINQKCINNLNLTYLNACDNNKIECVCHMSNITNLNAGWNCGIDQNCINKLHLYKLNAEGNVKINDVSHMTSTLKILYVGGYCNIDQNSISKLKLYKLNANDNHKITEVSHMASTLKNLNAMSGCGINQKCIDNLNLIKLNARWNDKITDVSHMFNLKTLDASCCPVNPKCGINQNGILNLNLVKLNVEYNKKINDVSYMTNLKILYAIDSGIDEYNICGLNLDEVYI